MEESELAGLPGQARTTVGGAYARPCVDVPRERWVEAIAALRNNGLDFFDWLTGVDDGSGGVQVVVHLWSVAERRGSLVRTELPAGELVLPSLVPVFPGAAWHERETFEMFGVVFEGHPDLRKLLLPDEFEGHPLRKDFVLAARVAKAWPGAKEPGESDSGAPSRRRIRPPGVPDPAEWGPNAAPPGADSAAAATGEAAPDRPRRTPRVSAPDSDRPRRTPPPDPAAPGGEG